MTSKARYPTTKYTENKGSLLSEPQKVGPLQLPFNRNRGSIASPFVPLRLMKQAVTKAKILNLLFSAFESKRVILRRPLRGVASNPLNNLPEIQFQTKKASIKI